MDNLSILLRAKLDLTGSQTDINTRIKELEKKLEKLNIKLNVDSTDIQKTVSSFSNIQKQIEQSVTSSGKIISDTNIKLTKDEVQQRKVAYTNLFDYVKQKENEITNNDNLRKQAQNYVKSMSSELDALSKKFSYGDQTSLKQLQQEFNKGGNFQSLESIPKTIDEYNAKIQKISSDLKISHQNNLTLLNEEISKEEKIAKEKILLENQITQAKSKQGSIIDDQIALQEKQSNQFSALLKEQMQQEIQDEKDAEIQKQKTLQLEKQVALFKEQKSIQLQNLQSSYDYNKYANSDIKSQVSSLQGEVINFNPQSLEEYTAQSQKLNTAISQTKANFNTAKSEAQGFGDTLLSNTGKMLQWTLAATAIFGSINALKDGISFINDLNKSMTNIQMITGKSSDEVTKMTKSFVGLATQLHETTSSMMQASEEFLRAGNNAQDTAKLLEASTVMSKIAGQSQADSAQSLISIMNAFHLNANEMMSVVDKMVAVDNVSATSTAELSAALQKASASAQASGVSLSQLISMIGVVSSVSRQSADTIGTAFNSIFSRYENVKAKVLTDENGESLNNVEKVLNHFGIAIRDQQNNFLSFNDVLTKVAQNWNKYNGVEQGAIATAVAGTRQHNQFLILMQNFNKVLQLQTTEADSAGNALNRYNTFAKSTQAKINDLTNTIQKMWMNTLNSSVINGIITGFTTILSVFNNFEQVLGIVIGSLIVFNSQAIINFVIGMGSFVQGLGSAIASMFTFTTVVDGSTVSLQGAALAAKGFQAALGVIGIAIVAFTTLWIAIDKINNSQKTESERIQQNIDKYNQEQQSINQLIESYKQNAELAKTNQDAKDKLYGIETQLVSIFGESAKKIDLETGSIDANIAKIKELSKTKAQEFIDANELIAKNNQEKLNDNKYTNSDYDFMSGQTYTLKGYLDRLKEMRHEANEEINAGMTPVYGNINDLNNEIDKYQKKYDSIIGIINQVNQAKKQISDANKPNEKPKKPGQGNYGNDGSSGSGSGSAKSDLEVDKTTIEKDRYYQLNQELAKTNSLLDDNVAKQENATYEEKLKLLNEEITLLKKKQQLEHDLAGEENKPIKNPSNYGDGNVDLNNRPKVSYTTMKAAGWNTEKGSYSTVDSTFYNGLWIGDEKTGHYATIHVTPILPNGKVLNPAQLEDYVNELVASGNPLKNDKLGLVLKVDDNSNLTDYDVKNQTAKFKAAEAEADKYDTKLHDSQAKIYSNIITASTGLRKEREELVKTLSDPKYGVKFAGSGDNINVTNAQQALSKLADEYNKANKALTSKSSKDEKQHVKDLKTEYDNLKASLDRFFEIQLTDLPKAQQEYAKLTKQIKDTNQSITDTKKQEISDNYSLLTSNIDEEIKQSQAKQSKLVEDSAEYTAEVQNQIALYKQKQDLIHQEADELRKILATQKEGTADYTKTNEDISQLSEKWQEIDKTIGDINNKQNDLIKSSVKSQLDSIKYVMDAEEKRHKERIDNLEKEKKTFDYFIDNQKNSLQELWDTEDYNKSVSEESKDILDTQAKISKLKMAVASGDKQAILEYNELQKTLTEQQSKLQDTQTNRSRDLQKDSLDKLKDDNDKRIDEETQAENDKYQTIKDNYDRLAQDIETFSDSSTVITSDMVNNMISDFNSLASSFDSSMAGMAESLRSKLLTALVDARNQIQNLNSEDENYLQSLVNNPNVPEQARNDISNRFQITPTPYDNSGYDPNMDANLALLNDPNVPENVKAEIRRRYGIPAYKEGGIDITGGLALLHGTSQKPEFILNTDQIKNLISNLTSNFSVPKISIPSLAGTNGFSMGDINVNVMGSLDKSVLPDLKTSIVTEIKKEFNRQGVYRPL